MALERKHAALLLSTFLIAACGIVYELLAGTVSSYLLGDSITQFSLVIGLFMASMGLGAFLARYVSSEPAQGFIWLQVTVALIGGSSALSLFFAFAYLGNTLPVLVAITIGVGAAVGAEIPFLIALLRTYRPLAANVSDVLTIDYLGALVASLLFPLVIVPGLGLIRASAFFGLLNLFVAAMAAFLYWSRLRTRRRMVVAVAIAAGGLAGLFGGAERLAAEINARLYGGEIVLAETTPYQKLVLTRENGLLRFFINGGLQFDSRDEYRYHESLVHPVMSLARRRRHVLILGGGDGLALREVLKHRDVETVTLVDLDPAVTSLFRRNDLLARMNGRAFESDRVRVVNEDAARYLARGQDLYDIAIIDLPDPHDLTLSRLYSRWFYGLLRARLTADGVFVTQATSPYYAREAFWTIAHTVEAAPGVYPLQAIPYHAYVPSFGDWGFVLAGSLDLDRRALVVSVPTRYLDAAQWEKMRHFASDLEELETPVNTLQTHTLARAYELGWSRWYR